MSDRFTEHLTKRLDHYLPPTPPTQAEWVDVQARARHTTSPRPGRSRRAWVAPVLVAAAVACGFVAVTHQRILEIVGVSQHASGPLEQQIVTHFPWPSRLHAIPSQSQVIFRLRQPASFDHNGPTNWWQETAFLTPLSNGRICGATATPKGGGYWSCSQPGETLTPFANLGPTAWLDSQNQVQVAPFVFWGVGPKNAETFTLQGGRGAALHAHRSKWIVAGHTIFLFPIPTRMLLPGGAPITLIARDATGHIIASQHTEAQYFHTFVYNRGTGHYLS